MYFNVGLTTIKILREYNQEIPQSLRGILSKSHTNDLQMLSTDDARGQRVRSLNVWYRMP